jgi:hypothetical protein
MIQAEKFIRTVYETAKRAFDSDGMLRAMAFVHVDGRIVIIDVHEGMDDKDRLAFVIKKACEGLDADGICLLSESWYLDDKDADEYQKNMDKYDGIASHPNKKEGVSFVFETKSGTTAAKANILRGPNGKPYLTDLHFYLTDGGPGRFQNFLRKA